MRANRGGCYGRTRPRDAAATMGCGGPTAQSDGHVMGTSGACCGGRTSGDATRHRCCAGPAGGAPPLRRCRCRQSRRSPTTTCSLAMPGCGGTGGRGSAWQPETRTTLPSRAVSGRHPCPAAIPSRSLAVAFGTEGGARICQLGADAVRHKYLHDFGQQPAWSWCPCH